MNIQYRTKRGAYMSRRIQLPLKQEIAKMVKRGIECRVKDDDGIEVGATWKEARRWHWYYDPEAI